MIDEVKKSRLRSFLSYPNGFSISAPIAAKPMTMYDVICLYQLLDLDLDSRYEDVRLTHDRCWDREPSESSAV